MTIKRRKLERSLGDILAAPATCDLVRDIQNRMRRARDQFLTFASFPGRVVEEILAPGARVADVARRDAVIASLVFRWSRSCRN